MTQIFFALFGRGKLGHADFADDADFFALFGLWGSQNLSIKIAWMKSV